MDGGGHDAGGDGGVAGHEGAGGEDDLAGLGGGLQASEVGADGLFVGVGPGGVVVQARDELQDVDELLGLGGGGGGRRC